MTPDSASPYPLVMIHAFPLERSMWQAQLERFGAGSAGLPKAIAPDLPGFGRAAPLEGSSTLEGYAKAVMAHLDRLSVEKGVFCGLSMGGYLLFEIWRRFPQRVAALVFCDTRAEADSPDVKANRRAAIQNLRQGRRQEVIEPLLPKLLAPALAQSEDYLGRLRQMADRASDEGIAAALQAMHDRPDSRDTLTQITVPTLVLVGKEDSITPPEAAAVIQKGIAASRLVTLPGAGHLSAWETPGPFNEALEAFLSRLPAAP